MTQAGERPYQAIEDYALLSNCRGCALVARDGSIDWACLERFDDAPSFSRLLDRRRGGWFSIRPAGGFETERLYLAHTNILQTTFTGETGVLTVHDFMLAPREGEAMPSLVRIVAATAGEVPVEVRYRPLDGFATSFGDLRLSLERIEGERLVCIARELPRGFEL